MIILDREKWSNCEKIELMLRPNYGTGEPIRVSFVKRISVDPETNEVSEVSYEHPILPTSHWANGHQIDEIFYIPKES